MDAWGTHGSRGRRPCAALKDLKLLYVPAEGTKQLRCAIAEFHGVDPDWVVVTTGASEALSALYCLAAEPGASILLPHPGFPGFAAMARAWGLGVTSYELDSRARIRANRRSHDGGGRQRHASRARQLAAQSDRGASCRPCKWHGLPDC
jgi:hypothetical protein